MALSLPSLPLLPPPLFFVHRELGGVGECCLGVVCGGTYLWVMWLVIEGQKMNLSKDLGHLGVYCILTMDKQQVRTQLVEDFKGPLRWNEGFFLYVKSPLSPLLSPVLTTPSPLPPFPVLVMSQALRWPTRKSTSPLVCGSRICRNRQVN